MNTHPYHYYVSYQFTLPSAGIGCIDVHLSEPIRGMSDINLIVDTIKRKSRISGVTINFFQRFEK